MNKDLKIMLSSIPAQTIFWRYINGDCFNKFKSRDPNRD